MHFAERAPTLSDERETALHNPPRAGPPCRRRSGGRDDSARRDEDRVFTTADRAIGRTSIERSEDTTESRGGDVVAWHGRDGRICRRRFRGRLKNRGLVVVARYERIAVSFLLFFLFFPRSLLTASRARCGPPGGSASRRNRSKVINHPSPPPRMH